jgi:hypothetical protein
MYIFVDSTCITLTDQCLAQTVWESVLNESFWPSLEFSNVVNINYHSRTRHYKSKRTPKSHWRTSAQEFEDKIYDPKEKDKSSGQKMQALLKTGKGTFQLLERYLSHYNAVLGGANYEQTGSNFSSITWSR